MHKKLLILVCLFICTNHIMGMLVEAPKDRYKRMYLKAIEIADAAPVEWATEQLESYPNPQSPQHQALQEIIENEALESTIEAENLTQQTKKEIYKKNI